MQLYNHQNTRKLQRQYKNTLLYISKGLKATNYVNIFRTLKGLIHSIKE